MCSSRPRADGRVQGENVCLQISTEAFSWPAWPKFQKIWSNQFENTQRMPKVLGYMNCLQTILPLDIENSNCKSLVDMHITHQDGLHPELREPRYVERSHPSLIKKRSIRKRHHQILGALAQRLPSQLATTELQCSGSQSPCQCTSSR